MKRILILLLAVSLILGLSSAAWAAGNINANITPDSSVVKSGTSVTISGTFTPDDIPVGDNRTEKTYRLVSSTGSEYANGTFSFTTVISESNKTVTLTLYEKTTEYVNNNISYSVENVVDSWSKTFTIATAPTMSESNISVSCSGYSLSTSGNTFQLYLPGSSIYNKETVTVSLSAGVSATFAGNAKAISFNAGTLSTATYAITATSEGYEPATYFLKIDKRSGSSASLSSLSVGGSSQNINATNFDVSNSTTSVNVSAGAGTNADVKIYDGNSTTSVIPRSGSLTAGTAYPFRVEVISPDGSNKATYNYTVTRAAAAQSSDTSMGTVTLAYGGNNVGSASGTTRTISVPNAYSSALSISATAGHTNATVTSISPSSITLSTAGQGYTFTVTVRAENGTTANHVYTVTRQAPAATNLVTSGALRTGSASGTSIATVGALTSASGTQSLSIPAANRSATSFWLTLSLPSGVSISSATITNGASASVSSGTVNLTNMASATTSWALTLNFNVGGSITFNISRVTSTSILSSVTFTYSGSTLGSLGAIAGTGSHTLNLNTSYTSATANWVLADGATFVSAKWGSNSTVTTAGTTSLPSVGLPASGSTALVLVIQASNGTQYTATINVSKNGSTAVNTLDSLYIKNKATSSTSSGNLFDTNPSSFKKDTLNYTVYVPSDYDTLYIYPTATSSSASIDVDGTYSNLYSRSDYYEVRLRSSSNKVNIKVTANGVTTTYTLTVEWEDEVVQNASLSSLYVSKSSTSSSSGNRYDITPSFSYNRTKYEVDLAKSVSEVYLHFETRQSSASVSVKNATKVSDGVYKATLSSNKTKTVTIEVSYKNDDTTYTVNLNSGIGSSHARLTRIRVASRESTSSSYQHTLLPSFDSSVLDYVALIPYSSGNTTTAYVQATLDEDADILTVDGDEVASGEWVEVSTRRGNSTSVRIDVEDNDGNKTRYNLSIVAAPSSANNDATLKKLSLQSSSSSSSEISLSSSFSKTTTSYTANNVANSVDSLRVYAEASDSSAWVIVNGVLIKNDYATVELDEGKNTITVQVYAEDCETNKTYTITVNRGAGGGSDSTLANLEARYGSSSGQTLNLIPAFAKNTTSYRINVDGSVAQVAFRPVASDDTAVIKIMGKDEKSGEWTSFNALSNDKNTFLITVTSGDGKNTSYYTVEVQRGLNVVVSAQKLKVNGSDVNCAAYNINGNNYFKLRDIAYALRGTPKSFDVTYNSATRVVAMTSGRNYSIIGGEMIKPLAPGKYQLSNQTVLLDGRSVNLTAYNVDGNNYFMLREIGQLFNFGVTYDSATSTMTIDSSTVYIPES